MLRETRQYRSYRDQRYFETKHKKELHEQRLLSGESTHISPFSTLVAAMGNYWKPGCFESIREMVQTTFDAGYEICFYEEHDRCYNPFDAIGSMRNMAYWRAIREGWEYLLYIDNDVIPPSNALVQLLNRRVPIISPIIVYADGDDHGLSMPRMPQGQGLALISSCVLSFLLIKTSVFFPWATQSFWGNALGDDEGYHFAKLEMAGHRPFVDTDIIVTCVAPPHFPLDEKKKMQSVQVTSPLPASNLWRPS